MPDVEGLSWPEGDAGALESAAGRVTRLGESVQAAGSHISGIASDTAGWTGLAAIAFSGAVNAQRAELARAGSGLADAGGAVRRLARIVDDAQDRVRQLAKRVREAEDEADDAAAIATAARATADQAEASAAAANPLLGSAAPFSPEAQAAQQAIGAAAQAESQAAEARARADRIREHATARADDEVDRVKAADDDAAGVVGAAIGLAPESSAPKVGGLPGLPRDFECPLDDEGFNNLVTGMYGGVGFARFLDALARARSRGAGALIHSEALMNKSADRIRQSVNDNFDTCVPQYLDPPKPPEPPDDDWRPEWLEDVNEAYDDAVEEVGSAMDDVVNGDNPIWPMPGPGRGPRPSFGPGF